MWDSKSLYEIRSNDIIYAYEGQDNFEPSRQVIDIQLLQRKVYTVNGLAKTELFGEPLLISIDINEVKNSLALRELIQAKMAVLLQFISEKVPTVKIGPDSFTVRIVSASGRRCGLCKENEVCAGCEVPNSSESIIGLDPLHQAISLDWDVGLANLAFSPPVMKVIWTEAHINIYRN